MTDVRRRTLLAASLRRRLPAAAIPHLHRLRLRQDLRTPRVVAQARAHMEFLVGAVEPEADLDELARGYLALTRWRIETRWHHERFLPPLRMEGVEHLAAARDGAVVNFLHHGPFERIGTSLGRRGHLVQMMIGHWFFADCPAPWLRQQRLIFERECTVFSSAEGSAGVLARLAAGATVSIATDLPGRTRMMFLGRDVMGSFGAARLAYQASRPVLVVTSHRDPAGEPFLRVHEPLQPERFDDPRQLLDRMLRIHEPAVLAWPEAYEEPRSKWGQPSRDPSVPAR